MRGQYQAGKDLLSSFYEQVTGLKGCSPTLLHGIEYGEVLSSLGFLKGICCHYQSHAWHKETVD
jgi:hypothetical protein